MDRNRTNAWSVWSFSPAGGGGLMNTSEGATRIVQSKSMGVAEKGKRKREEEEVEAPGSDGDDEGEAVQRVPAKKGEAPAAKTPVQAKPERGKAVGGAAAATAGGGGGEGEQPAKKKKKIGKKERDKLKALKASGVDPEAAKLAVVEAMQRCGSCTIDADEGAAATFDNVRRERDEERERGKKLNKQGELKGEMGRGNQSGGCTVRAARRSRELRNMSAILLIEEKMVQEEEDLIDLEVKLDRQRIEFGMVRRRSTMLKEREAEISQQLDEIVGLIDMCSPKKPHQNPATDGPPAVNREGAVMDGHGGDGMTSDDPADRKPDRTAILKNIRKKITALSKRIREKQANLSPHDSDDRKEQEREIETLRSTLAEAEDIKNRIKNDRNAARPPGNCTSMSPMGAAGGAGMGGDGSPVITASPQASGAPTGPRLYDIVSRLEGASVSSTFSVEAETVLLPGDSSTPPEFIGIPAVCPTSSSQRPPDVPPLQLHHIMARGTDTSVLSPISVKAEEVQVPEDSSVPPLVWALAPMLGLFGKRSTPDYIWTHASKVIAKIPLDHPFWESQEPLTESQRAARVLLITTFFSNGGDNEGDTPRKILPSLMAMACGRQIFIYDWDALVYSTPDAAILPTSTHGSTTPTWYPPLCLAWDGARYFRLSSPLLSTEDRWSDPDLRAPSLQWRLPWFACFTCTSFGCHKPDDCKGPVRNVRPDEPFSMAEDPCVRLLPKLTQLLNHLYSSRA